MGGSFLLWWSWLNPALEPPEPGTGAGYFGAGHFGSGFFAAPYFVRTYVPPPGMQPPPPTGSVVESGLAPPSGYVVESEAAPRPPGSVEEH